MEDADLGALQSAERRLWEVERARLEKDMIVVRC
jgi:hypothetical protein